MTHHPTDRPSANVVYTCWPLGGLLCGVATMGIGILLLVEHYFDAAPEVLWGIGLLVLGAAIVMWTHRSDTTTRPRPTPDG